MYNGFYRKELKVASTSTLGIIKYNLFVCYYPSTSKTSGKPYCQFHLDIYILDRPRTFGRFRCLVEAH